MFAYESSDFSALDLYYALLLMLKVRHALSYRVRTQLSEIRTTLSRLVTLLLDYFSLFTLFYINFTHFFIVFPCDSLPETALVQGFLFPFTRDSSARVNLPPKSSINRKSNRRDVLDPEVSSTSATDITIPRGYHLN